MGEFKRLLNRVIPLVLILVLVLSSVPISASAATKSYIAEPTTFKITMDGVGITVRNYEIDYKSTLYVKIRDIASVFNGTDKYFSVAFNSKKNTLTLTPGKIYTDIGGENKKRTSKSVSDKAYDKGTKLYLGSKKQSAKVYIINDEQYVSLTSLAKIIDFSLKKSKSTYKIDTTTGYSDVDADSSTQSPSLLVPSDSAGLLKNPFPNAELIRNPRTVDDCINILAYLITNNLMTYTFDVDISYEEAVKEGGLQDLFKTAANPEETPELFRGAICNTDISIKRNGTGTQVIVKFKGWSTQTGDSLAKLNKEYFIKTQAAVQKLIDSGKITSSMTESKKAFQIFKWISLNVFPVLDEFDDNPKYMKESSATGYDAIVSKTTTSIGYTALYNLMCRFVGSTKINTMQGTSFGRSHMWTFQELDGKKVITDVANGFADGTEFMPAYFAMHTTETDYYLKWDKVKYADYVSNFEYVEDVGDETFDEWYNENYGDGSDIDSE
ncbi:hypothetical protein SAMN02745136_00531 [Anaerocolumna jejuensis DSM 15929]|uniref:Uncharacterized protein n=1 Tax=Anaerocolumna jejuensis DSM 15929 TaxID=1121322 RepID=A0A1M6KPN6_9FIRM|nr:hypothetical protein [Anaerocolumna jejuensis]SHJ60851.1 hypothetical protein SAMN02745136_00531 [Anaerocolumna jejuensis DSM 15929]